MSRAVVIDVDTGSDDAWAIALLLWGERRGNYSVKGITCVKGNAPINNVCRNTLQVLEVLGRTEVPVFRGAEEWLLNLPFTAKLWHGENGFGNIELEEITLSTQEKHAVQFLIDTVAEFGEIDLICTGPLTNIALAIKIKPEIKEKIGKIYIMGGNITAVGNVNQSTAEFNFYVDPEAAHIVLNSFDCPIVLLPWETCGFPDELTPERRFTIIGTINPKSKFLKLMNEVEKNLYTGREYWNPCDAFLVACYIDSRTIVQSRALDLTVELCGGHTRGQGVILRNSRESVQIIGTLNFSHFTHLLKTMLREI